MFRRLAAPVALLLLALLGLAVLPGRGASHHTAQDRGRERDFGPEDPREAAERDGITATVHSAAASTLLQARAHAEAMAVSTQFASAWKELGPKPYISDDPASVNTNINGWGNVGGRTTALAVDPADGNIVFAGAAGGGVWRTTDGGDHWTPQGDGLPTTTVGAVAIDPANRHTIFVGTGESNTGGDNIYGSGVYRSTDDGAHWFRAAQNIPDAATVAHIEIAGGRIFVASSKGLFRSTDGGGSYQDVLLPTNAAGTAPDPYYLSNIVSDVRVKPGTPDEVTAAVGWRKGKKAGSTPGALYRSTTGGGPGSFTRLAPTGFGQPDPNPQSTDPVGRTSLSYSAADPNTLWAVIEDAGVEAGDTFVGSGLPPKYTSLNGVYRSSDDGGAWVIQATSAELAADPTSGLVYRLPQQYGPGIQAWYDQWILADPLDANTVLMGLEEVYRGVTAPAPGPTVWHTIGRYNNLCEVTTPCDPTLPGPVAGGTTTHPDQHAAAVTTMPGGTERLYVGNDGGVYRQDRPATGFDSEHWVSLNTTYGTTQPYDAVMSGDGTVYLGLQDNGTAQISPAGKGIMVEGGDGFDVAVDPADAKNAFTEMPYGDIETTTNGGNSWNSVAPSDLAKAQFDAPIEMDPRNPKHVVFAGRQVYETVSGGATGSGDWATAFDTGHNAAANIDNSVTAVGVEGASVYAGFCGVCDVITEGLGDQGKFQNGIATNVQAGCAPATGKDTCWHKAAAVGLPNRLITDIAIDQSDPATVWVTLGGYGRRGFAPLPGPGVGSGHLFVSHDRGEHFADASGDLPDAVANSVTLRDAAVVVGTDVGTFVGTKGGSAFARLGVGMPNAPVWRTNLNPDGSKLVAATHGRGVWVYDFGAAAALGGSSRPGAAGSGGGKTPATGGPSWPGVVGVLLLAAALLTRTRSRRRASGGPKFADWRT
jgi:hypothetical protein